MSTFRSRIILAALSGFLAVLTGCASTPDRIVGAPEAVVVQPTPDSPKITLPAGTAPAFTPGPILARDLVSAAYNLDEAVRVGAIPANDPAVACVHDALQHSGLDGGGAVQRQSFEPKKDGVVSMGAILYIMVEQARTQAAAAKAFELSPACLQIIGRLQVDALKATAKAGLAVLPGAIAGGAVGDLKAISGGVKMLEAMPRR